MNKGERVSLLTEATNKIAPLRSFFVSDEDSVIFKVISNFFSAVKDTFPNEWEKEDSIFKRTVGYLGLIKVFKQMSMKGAETKKLSKDFFLSELNNFKGARFDGVQLSSKGVNQVYERLTIQISPDFKSELR